MTAAPKSFLNSKAFLVGIVAGLVACSIWARHVTHNGFHREFTRFHVKISPEAQYYPTIEEMRGIVRSRCKPNQILVLVGGNSIFHGVGQPVGKLWTEELQRLLGPEYAVVNLAFRGAACTDGGALVAESLRREFPRQLYVANTAPLTAPDPIGVETYRYLLWQARTFGLLEEFPPRERRLREFISAEYSLATRFANFGAEWLDRVLRYRDLWNWVSFRHVFTVQSPYTTKLPEAVWPRGQFKDEETDYDWFDAARRYPDQTREAEMAIVRGFSAAYFQGQPDGSWQVNRQHLDDFAKAAKIAFPDDLKARTLIMLSRNSPHYRKFLSSEERARDDLAYAEGIMAWRSAGYSSAEYGVDFDEMDFGDRTHLAASGGRKLAAVVAHELKRMAAELNYFQTPAS